MMLRKVRIGRGNLELTLVFGLSIWVAKSGRSGNIRSERRWRLCSFMTPICKDDQSGNVLGIGPILDDAQRVKQDKCY